MKTYRAAIVGCGRVAGGLEQDPLREHPCTHAGIYKSSPRVELIACAARTKESAAAFAKTWGIPARYDSYAEMLAKEKIEILSICAPAPLHAEITRAAAKSGVKAIFCEKAMATSLKEADAMIRACTKYGVFLTVNHLRRWGWDWETVKHLLEQDEIGDVQSATCYYSGSLMHTGTHLFDILGYLLGEVSSVQAGFPNTQDSPDPDLSGLLQFQNGVQVFVNGRGKKFFQFEMDILGSQGRIRIGNHLLELWKSAASKHYTDFVELEKFPFPKPDQRPNPWLAALDDILHSLDHQVSTRSTGMDARKALEIGFALALSAQNQGKPISLPLKNCPLKIESK